MILRMDDDLALAVRDARKRLRQLHHKKQELQDKVSMLKSELEDSKRAEEKHLAKLRDLRAETDQKAFFLCLNSTDIAVLQSLCALIEERTEQDELTVKNLGEALLQTQQEGLEMTRKLADQRAETLRVIKQTAKDWAVLDQRRAAERNEIMQVHQERVEIEARTEAACLKHARELFGVSDQNEH